MLYYGDNLDILRHHIPDESVDLIYLDPPFNSNRAYNVLFKETTARGSEAQIEAFEDTWHWGRQRAASLRRDRQAAPHQNVARMLKAMVEGLGHNDVIAYLTMMAIRLVELHRVLKPTGSPLPALRPDGEPLPEGAAGRGLRPAEFRNEIVWKRTDAHSDVAKQFGPSPRHDPLLREDRDAATWNPYLSTTRPSTTIAELVPRRRDGDWPALQPGDMTEPEPGSGQTSTYEWQGRHPRSLGAATQARRWRRSTRPGRSSTRKSGDRLRLQALPGRSKGMPLQDVWDDIRPINSQADERLGYPTQKPLALLERIISASSNPGDIVLDPFCGCGTAVARRPEARPPLDRHRHHPPRHRPDPPPPARCLPRTRRSRSSASRSTSRAPASWRPRTSTSSSGGRSTGSARSPSPARRRAPTRASTA